MADRRPTDPARALACPTCQNGKCPTIDSTPVRPEPPAVLIEGAMLVVPEAFSAGVNPKHHEGRIEAPASHLAQWVCDRGHTPAAAEWAIHRLIQEGKLTAHMVPAEVPSVLRTDGTWWPPDPHGWDWLPENGPAPFDCFLVRATESLWRSWREKTAVGGSATGTDLLTLGELADLAMVSVKTMRNTLSASRTDPDPNQRPPEPAERGSGRQPHRYSYAAIQAWLCSKYPLKAIRFPGSFDDVQRILQAHK